MDYSESTRCITPMTSDPVKVGTLVRRRDDHIEIIATSCTPEIAEEIIESHDLSDEWLLEQSDGTWTAPSVEPGWTWVFTTTETVRLAEYAERQRQRERRATLLRARDEARRRRRDRAKREAELARSREKPKIAEFQPDLAELRANADNVDEQRRLARAAAFAATPRGRRLLRERMEPTRGNQIERKENPS